MAFFDMEEVKPQEKPSSDGRIITLNGKKVRVLGIRRLTPAECARLQTMPTWYAWYGNYADEVMDGVSTKGYNVALGLLSSDVVTKNVSEVLSVIPVVESSCTPVKVEGLSVSFDTDIPDSSARSVLFVKGKDETSLPAGFTREVDMGGYTVSVMPDGVLSGRLPESTDEAGFIKALKSLHDESPVTAVSYLIAWALCRGILSTMHGVSLRVDGMCTVAAGRLTWELTSLRIGQVKQISDSSIYKALGNGWTVDVVKHFFSFLPKEWRAA